MSSSKPWAASAAAVVRFARHGLPVEVWLVRAARQKPDRPLAERIGQAAHGAVIEVSELEVRSAVHRVADDRTLGRATPRWISAVAGLSPDPSRSEDGGSYAGDPWPPLL
jgi:hypothetical protein